MVMLRLTPASALSTVRQLGADLARAARDAGRLAAAPNLGEALADLDADCGRKVLRVDVLLGSGLAPDATDAWLTWLGGGSAALASGGIVEVPPVEAGAWPLELRLRRMGEPVPLRVGRARPPVLVAVLGRVDDGVREDVLQAADGRPCLLLAGSDPGGLAAIRTAAQAWVCEIVDSPAPGGFAKRWAVPPWSTLREALAAQAALAALESLSSAFAQALEQEQKAVKLKRGLTQQKVSGLQQRAVGGSEVVAEARSRLQRLLSDYQRGVQDRMERLLEAPGGALWEEVEAHLAGLDDLERETRQKAIHLRLPGSFLDELQGVVATRIQGHCVADLQALADLVRVASSELEQGLTRAGGPPLLAQFRYMTDERVPRLLEGVAGAGRQYKGELPRPGFFEYAMVARRYQMILFMFISAFGLSFLRQYRELMVPAAVVLLSFGAWNVVASTRRERAEGLARELEKAREAVRSDLRRSLAEVQRAWLGLVQQHLNDEVASVVGQIEAAVREHQSRRQGEQATEKERVQKQVQTLETSERRLAAPAKARETVAAALAQARGELRQVVVNTLAAPAEAARPSAVPPRPPRPSISETRKP